MPGPRGHRHRRVRQAPREAAERLRCQSDRHHAADAGGAAPQARVVLPPRRGADAENVQRRLARRGRAAKPRRGAGRRAANRRLRAPRRHEAAVSMGKPRPRTVRSRGGRLAGSLHRAARTNPRVRRRAVRGGGHGAHQRDAIRRQHRRGAAARCGAHVGACTRSARILSKRRPALRRLAGRGYGAAPAVQRLRRGVRAVGRMVGAELEKPRHGRQLETLAVVR